ncbi:hypothetical protein ASF88_12315 [Leifsonia sp. Leaf336]|nr:hypothetical protein ASF88_12315 [Leifsonia sp. Leaf336]
MAGSANAPTVCTNVSAKFTPIIAVDSGQITRVNTKPLLAPRVREASSTEPLICSEAEYITRMAVGIDSCTSIRMLAVGVYMIDACGSATPIPDSSDITGPPAWMRLTNP